MADLDDEDYRAIARAARRFRVIKDDTLITRFVVEDTLREWATTGCWNVEQAVEHAETENGRAAVAEYEKRRKR